MSPGLAHPVTQQPQVLGVSLSGSVVLHSSSPLPCVVLWWVAGAGSMEMEQWEPAKLGCLPFGVKCDVHGGARPGSHTPL